MAKNVLELFRNTVAARGDRVGAQYKVAGAWRDVTWNEIDTISRKAAAGLAKVGIEKGERVTVLSNTRIEWCMADLGIMGAGGTTVPVYQSNTPDEVAFILNDAGSVAVFAEDGEQLKKMRAIRGQVPQVRKVICFLADDVDKDSDWEMSWDDLLSEGEAYLEANTAEMDERADSLNAESILTFIYTSGTTGNPKGAILTHDCMLYEAEALQQVNVISPDDVQYIFLPMAHVFAKVLEVAWFATGHVLAFWEGDQKKIVDNLGEVRPTMMAAVPRIYEKVHAKVVSDVEATGGVGGKIARWGLKKGEEAAKIEQAGGTPGGVGWNLAQKLVFSKLNQRLTARFGGRLRFFVSGGAPLGKDIAYFFKYAGVKICEGYGLTETSAATTVNLPNNIKVGTVGEVIPGTEVKIAEDGEILIRGRGVMKGYWNREDATKEAIDEDGWFHSGDIGEFDQDGFLRITDRKKDIIVTAGGKNVAPQNIENSLKSKSPLISQVVVHGDQRKYLTALVTVDAEALEVWAKDKGQASGGFDFKSVSQSDALNKEIEGIVNEVNGNLARYETLKKFRILDHDFEIGDQLTPTLKVKRKLCNERYKDLFDGMYDA